MRDVGVDAAWAAGAGRPLKNAAACLMSRSIGFFVAKPSGAVRPGCKLGVSLLLPPSLLYLGTLRNIFLLRRCTWR